MRAQVANDFYPVSISCGCRVSCAETLGVNRISRQVGGVSLEHVWSESDFPAKSELFYSDMVRFSGSQNLESRSIYYAPDFVKESVNFALEFSLQVQQQYRM